MFKLEIVQFVVVCVLGIVDFILDVVIIVWDKGMFLYVKDEDFEQFVIYFSYIWELGIYYIKFIVVDGCIIVKLVIVIIYLEFILEVFFYIFVCWD